MVSNLLLGSGLAFVVTFYIIPRVIALAKAKKLYDIPDARKVHKDPIPSLGGIGIFAGITIALVSFTSLTIEASAALQAILLAMIVLFLVGLKDDIVTITPKQKLLGQITSAAILMFKGGFVITNMHGFLGVTAISGTFSYVITGFTIIVILNAYNLIDGIDGLAGCISVLSSIAFAVYFAITGHEFFALLGFTLAASVLGFLIYNFEPAKIFMGDTGSMLCGMISAVLAIRFIEVGNQSTILSIPSTPALAFGILIMPLLDTLRVFSIRIVNGRSPFSADKNHLHHMLLDKGITHKAITGIISFAAVFFMALSYFVMPHLSTTYLILLQIGFYFAIVAAIKFSSKKWVIAPTYTFEEEALITEQSFTTRVRNVVSLITTGEKVTNKN